MNIYCLIIGHEEHYSGKKGSISYHKGYDGVYFCYRCGKILKGD